MTQTVSAIANAASTTDAQRTSAAPTSGTSFARLQAAAVKDTESTARAAATSSSDDTSATSSSTSAPKGEKTQKVAGHGYVEIVSGPRNGMFINNTGSKRDGEAFLIVKRHGREFHVYGTGHDRKVYEVGRPRETTGTSGTSGTSGSGTTGSGTTSSDTSGSSTTSASDTSGASTTGTTTS
jgi:hypothetical protein